MAQTEEQNIPRRTFCNRLLLTSAALAAMSADINGQPNNQRENYLFYPPQKVEGAERMLPGSALYFSYPTAKNPAVLVRSAEGEYMAYSRKCAHLGCSVDFEEGRACLSCPCHRGVYDSRSGRVVYGPPSRPLDQIILQMRAGGEVWAVGRSISSDIDEHVALSDTDC